MLFAMLFHKLTMLNSTSMIPCFFHSLIVNQVWVWQVESSRVELSWVELSRVLADRLRVSELDELMWVTVEHSVSVFNAQTQTGIHLRCYSTANISTKVVWNWDKFNQQQAKPKSSFHIFIWIIEQSFFARTETNLFHYQSTDWVCVLIS